MSENPYLRRNQHRIGSTGRRSERRIGKDLGARERPASGAMEGAKGDLDLGATLMEAKSTTQNAMSIKLEWLCKIGGEARAEGKTPALAVSFVNPDGSARMDGDWVMIPMHKFKEMQ